MKKVIERVESGDYTKDDIKCLVEFAKKFYPERPIDMLFNYFCQRTNSEPKRVKNKTDKTSVMLRRTFVLLALDELISIPDIAGKLEVSVDVVYRYRRQHRESMKYDDWYREFYENIMEKLEGK